MSGKRQEVYRQAAQVDRYDARRLGGVKQKQRTGRVITDQLAAQVGGRYLKQLIEEGYDAQRQVYTMSVDEVLQHLDAVVEEAKGQGNMPQLPPGV